MSLGKWRRPVVFTLMGAAARGEKMDALPEKVRLFLLQHPTLEVVPGNKVRFTVTGHELPCRLPDLQNFTEGKKYQRLMNRPPAFDYSAYEPHIVPSTKNEFFLNPCDPPIASPDEECQKQGVDYVPFCMQSKKKQRHLKDNRAGGEGGQMWKPEDSHSEDSDSGDSMSDLYPANMFSKKSAAEEENGSLQTAGDEEMEVEENIHSNQKKRPQKQNGSSQKKFKSNHKKPKTSKKL
ncbi:hypothetical protein GDO78_012921 [Eleutherodactylus coqui]|uniref:Uncharacterized protein n=1 Tax=Eleutherodactylus coqui TaxID=57060 RepID=A0A8J6EYC4_ELECQ|nr:hypothetical protein GDO78_012921 [Eleutherodactylus coqui]